MNFAEERRRIAEINEERARQERTRRRRMNGEFDEQEMMDYGQEQQPEPNEEELE